MTSEIQNHADRRAMNERRNSPERRNDSERRNEGDRRDLLIGLGGKIVAAPQPRDTSHTHVPGMPGSRSHGSPLEYIHPEGQFKVGSRVPLSPAVRAGNVVYVSGVPAYDAQGRIAVGNFSAQMKQVMLNITGILKAAGTDWMRVVKVNVLLTRLEDVPEMNRIYAAHFIDAKYPARTTAVVSALPNPEFMLEIECIALAG